MKNRSRRFKFHYFDHQKFHWAWWFVTASIILLAILIQSNIFLSWDVSWRMIITHRFIDGGKYVLDFIDMNPPILLYTMAPSVLLTKILPISDVVAARLIIFVIGFVSLIICYLLLKYEILNSFKQKKGALLASIAFIYFLLPVYEFGQREHIVLILLIPYFLFCILQVRSIRVPLGLTIAVAILAGIGFCINIEYIVLLLCLLIWRIIHNRSLVIFKSIDFLIIIIVIMTYLLSVIVLTPDYLHIVLPLVLRYYVPSFNYDWNTLFMNGAFFTWLSIFILMPFHYRSQFKVYYQAFLLIATIFIIQFFLTQKVWYYHMLPSLAMGILSFTLFLVDDIEILIERMNKKQKIHFRFLFKIFTVYSCLLFFPISIAYMNSRTMWIFYHDVNQPKNKMLAFIRNTKVNSPIYVFSTTVDPAPTLAQYGNVKLGSRFAGIWLLPGVVKEKQGEKFLQQLITEDFIRYQPNLVFVNVGQYKAYFGNMPFDYIEYFSQEPKFKLLWQKYHFVTKIDDYEIYQRLN